MENVLWLCFSETNVSGSTSGTVLASVGLIIASSRKLASSPVMNRMKKFDFMDNMI